MLIQTQFGVLKIILLGKVFNNMANPLIKMWFYDNFENIIDEAVTLTDLKNEIIDTNDCEFHEEIEHQSVDEFIRSVCISCSSRLGLPYDEVYDTLEEKLEELYESIA